ncbi:unnamed protein product [Lymnaea stagnalis]|uniref:poly(A)-specific ribonuclease n=1 Tax=Lymnaea stagnalis TaxID=6523 RepID=A0AAV2HBU8_LYMST
MGKILDGDKSDVKREVVSASANLEVISQESFVKRLEGMSSTCVNCQRERTRTTQRNKTGRKGKSGRRKQHSKSTMPIVIHLKDTLPSGKKYRQSSLDGDSDVSTKSTDEEQQFSGYLTDSHHIPPLYSDVDSIPEFIPQYNNHHFHQSWPQPFYHQIMPSGAAQLRNHSRNSTSQKAKEKSRKNLTALISVIEKAHRKEPLYIEPNLSKNSPDAKLCNMFNNFSFTSHSDQDVKRKNMAHCNNVDLICNDLSKSAEKLLESPDDSDSSDKVSLVSSSDTLSDDVADLPVPDELRGHDLTLTELEELAEYTTGAPLIRYDCPPPHCPECVHAWHTLQYYQYEGCAMYTSPCSHPHVHTTMYTPPRHHPCPHRPNGGQKAASPRTSLSSDSDVSSDVEDGSTTSSSSSSGNKAMASVQAGPPSSGNKTMASVQSGPASSGNKIMASVQAGPPSSGNKAMASAKTSPTSGQHQSKRARNPRGPFGRINSSKDPRHSVKRATASWTGARQLWDIDVAHNHGSPVTDSVYMDLTGLDVTISVMYHTCSTPTWPYPVHSLYQAMYTPTALTSPNLQFSSPIFYPQKFDSLPIHEFKKYEMTLPPSRPWITTGTCDKDVPAAVFSVMCYNVLCDKLCTKAMYAYCPTWALSWDYRKKGIMNDIIRNNADILTLQEVETEQYYSMFLPELAAQGYNGIFLPKSRVRTMNSDKEKKCVDGCAIFYKKNKFEKVNEYQIEFSQLATKEGASNTDTDMINRVSTKDNIAIVAVLKTRPDVYLNSPVTAPKGLTQMLMVSTAHIHWDPQSPDVKLVQTMMLIEELQKFVKETSMQFRPNAPPPSLDADLCNSMPLILCGDFNSLPDSGVYEFLSKGRLDTSHKDFEGQNYQVFMKDRNANGIITHNFNLTSAYKDVMPFTNYTFDFKGVIDYIFYSDQHLRLHGVMGLQDEEWFRANKIIGCPHPFVPSDHFPLFAEFSLPAHPQRPR